MNIELKPIAESKIRQLGGDVCGVLVRKDQKLAAVDEHGRVMWLDSWGEAGRAQGGQGAEPIGWVHSKHLKELEGGHPIRVYHQDTPVVFDSKVPVYTHPQTAQQGSVPEGHVAIPTDIAAAKGMYLVGYSWLKHNAPQELATPQPEGDGWVSCSERLPEQLNQEYLVRVDSQIHSRPRMFVTEYNEYGFDRSKVTHWMPLPQPPKEGKGDE
ncbi:DUF551 domain-containing protein [Marinobacter nauticus]|uniref:DUF551 domain-containing protein n=1 Tax=Marinobacter nauticus TaxID=2743 RepID=A0A1M2V0U9_MARNT|nr:DUF551 domain-containing protein [Marinobacter nauticus]OJT01195.1 hypothetical protein BEE62_14685 [Marinobacter nauticus]